jgi:hypothetical protein
MREAIGHAVDAYRSGEGSPGGSRFSPYHALNRLMMEALLPGPEGGRQAAVELARQCGAGGARGYAAAPNAWDAVIQCEAVLVEHLIDGSLGQEGDEGSQAFAAVAQANAEALGNVSVKPSQLDSMATQLELLSRLADALSLDAAEGAALWRSASRLLELAQRLQPERGVRSDRPPAPKPAAAPPPRRPPRRR